MLNKIRKQNLSDSEKKVSGKKNRPKGLGEGLGENRVKILQIMSDKPNVSIPELSGLIGISTTGIEKNIKYLKEHNYLKRIGSAKGGYWEIIKQ